MAGIVPSSLSWLVVLCVAAGCSQGGRPAQQLLEPIRFGLYDGLPIPTDSGPPYELRLERSSLPKDYPAVLPVLEVVPKKMPLERMIEIARKLGLQGPLVRHFGRSPRQWDVWAVKNEDYILQFWPDVWRWEWYDKTYLQDIQEGTKHVRTRQVMGAAQLARIVRSWASDEALLPADAQMEPPYATLRMGRPDEIGSSADYMIVYRRPLAGYQVAGLANAALFFVSTARRQVVKADVRWLPLEPSGAYPLRSVKEGFQALRDGNGEQIILPPFIEGKATFTGVVYHTAHDLEFHPCYRFTIRVADNEQHFFVPAIRPDHYEDGTAVVHTSEREHPSEAYLCTKVTHMLAKLERDCRPLLDGRHAGRRRETEEILSDICWEVPRFAASIIPNLVPSVKGQWGKTTLRLTDRLLVAIGTDVRPADGPTPLQGTLAHIAEDLIKLVEKHGTVEDKRAVEKVRAQYSKRWTWAKEFIFGIE